MNACPNCGKALTETRQAYGLCWRCAACGGCAMTVAVLRRTVLAAAVNELWQAARAPEAAAGRPCPDCGAPMHEAAFTAGGSTVRVDVCLACTVLWFDGQEYEALPPLPPEPAPAPEPELPPAAREALALAQIQEIAERYRTDEAAPAPSGWQWLLAWLRLPVEMDDPGTRGAAWVTWALTAAVTVVSLLVLSRAPEMINRLGFIPAHAWRYGGFTFISVFFLHGGIAHLLGNMYFLLVFGNNVEDFLGRARYALLLLAATVAGGLAHTAANPASTMPCIGASGGIAGVMACYALAFPRSRFGLLIYYRLVCVPAYAFVLLWVGMQVIGAWEQVKGFTNVSAFAHLGGASMGLLFWLLWRPSSPRPAPGECAPAAPAEC